MKFIVFIIIFLLVISLLQFVFFVAKPFTDGLFTKQVPLDVFQNIGKVKLSDGSMPILAVLESQYSPLFWKKDIKNLERNMLMVNLADIRGGKVVRYSLKMSDTKEDEYEIVKTVLYDDDETEEKDRVVQVIRDSLPDDQVSEDIFAQSKEVITPELFSSNMDIIVFKKLKTLFESDNSVYAQIISLCDKTIQNTDSTIRSKQWNKIAAEYPEQCFELSRKMLISERICTNRMLAGMFNNYSNAFSYLTEKDFAKFELNYKKARKTYLKYLVT